MVEGVCSIWWWLEWESRIFAAEVAFPVRRKVGGARYGPGVGGKGSRRQLVNI
jgi:hypothetical protein